MTNEDRVREHLEAGNTITSLEAINLFGVTRLSAVIFELRHDGLKIDAERVPTRNRYGKAVSVVRYRLRRETDE